MLEFDRKKFKELRKAMKYTQQDIADYLSNRGIDTPLITVKSWTLKKNPRSPDYEKVSALAELFGIPSLHLFRGGESELTKNIQLELKRNPDKYEKYFKGVCYE